MAFTRRGSPIFLVTSFFHRSKKKYNNPSSGRAARSKRKLGYWKWGAKVYGFKGLIGLFGVRSLEFGFKGLMGLFGVRSLEFGFKGLGDDKVNEIFLFP